MIGLLKVGSRKLFIRAENGSIREITPLCVFDFYVHESVQRGGQGKQIFEEMLHREGDVHPAKLAYDRPSPKLIGFLAKHYGLRNYVPQNNNYIVFSQYWDPNPTMYKPLKAPAPNAFAAMDAGAASGTQRAARTVRFADQEESQAAAPIEPVVQHQPPPQQPAS